MQQGQNEPFALRPSLRCPHCASGSSALYESQIGRTEWDDVTCAKCGETFEIARAVDDALVGGPHWISNLRLFGGLEGLHQKYRCAAGDTALMDVRGVFERVYHVAFGSSGTWMADGIAVRYLPTGFVMVAVAPAPEGWEGLEDSQVDVTVAVIGRLKGAPEVETWRELFLEACISSRRSRRLAPILAVAGADAFFGNRLGRDVAYSELEGRPQSWSTLAEEIAGKSLLDLLDNPGYSQNLRAAVRVRNSLAHGGDPKEPLMEVSEELAEEEKRWERVNNSARQDLRLAPSGEFVLRHTLTAIRAVRREDRADTHVVMRNGLGRVRV